jgi:hypothetical protein
MSEPQIEGGPSGEAKRLGRELGRGRSEWSGFLVHNAVLVVVLAFVAVVVAAALLALYLS